MSDSINHPSHYNSGKFEAIDVIEDWNLGFNLGNTVKYISRAGKKDATKTVEDLRKAAWYLQREISKLESKEQSGWDHVSDALNQCQQGAVPATHIGGMPGYKPNSNYKVTTNSDYGG